MKIRRHAGTYRVTTTKALDPPNASGRKAVEVTLALFSGPDAEADAREYVKSKEGGEMTYPDNVDNELCLNVAEEVMGLYPDDWTRTGQTLSLTWGDAQRVTEHMLAQGLEFVCSRHPADTDGYTVSFLRAGKEFFAHDESLPRATFKAALKSERARR